MEKYTSPSVSQEYVDAALIKRQFKKMARDLIFRLNWYQISNKD